MALEKYSPAGRPECEKKLFLLPGLTNSCTACLMIWLETMIKAQGAGLAAQIGISKNYCPEG